MTAAIWSTPPGRCFLDFPAKTLVSHGATLVVCPSLLPCLQIQFMYNHHLLQITGKPSWLTIQGGSHNYVNAILSKLPEAQLHLSTPIVSATTREVAGSSRHKVVLRTQQEKEVEYGGKRECN